MGCDYCRSAVVGIVVLLCGAGSGAEPADLIARLTKLDGGSAIRAAVHVDDRTSRTDDVILSMLAD